MLDGLRHELGRGITALVGVNGAGKTTLLTTAAGGLRPQAGRVLVDGFDPYARHTRARALRSVALMPQAARFPGGMTALEVVEYLAWTRGSSGRTARLQAHEALGEVGLAERAGDKVRSLSGGMVRRLALAQAVATRPSVLLLDEPSTGLDPRQRRTMVELLSRLDGTVLLSSHVLEDVVDLADRVLVLHGGAFVFDGTLPELAELAPPGTDGARQLETGLLQLIDASDAR